MLAEKTVIYHLPFEISESIYLLDSFFFFLSCYRAPPSSFSATLPPAPALQTNANESTIHWLESVYRTDTIVRIVRNKNSHWNNKNVCHLRMTVCSAQTSTYDLRPRESIHHQIYLQLLRRTHHHPLDFLSFLCFFFYRSVTISSWAGAQFIVWWSFFPRLNCVFFYLCGV